jgi:hypothetical protein
LTKSNLPVSTFTAFSKWTCNYWAANTDFSIPLLLKPIAVLVDISFNILPKVSRFFIAEAVLA